MTSALNRCVMPTPESSISAFRSGALVTATIGTSASSAWRAGHQALQRPDLPDNQVAERSFLLSDDDRPSVWRFVPQKTLADRGGGEALKLPCETPVIEHMAARAEHLIERSQMKRIGVGQRAVNVEQQPCRPRRHP
jgi:hypothetical protein